MVVPFLMLKIPTLYKTLLAPALLPPFASPYWNPVVFEALHSFVNVYCVICLKQLVGCGTLVFFVVRHLSEDAKTDLPALCQNGPWAAGMISVILGLASMFTSFIFASSLRFVPMHKLSATFWLQNARLNASSPWKNVETILAAPSVLGAWSLIFCIIHTFGWEQCGTIPTDGVYPMPKAPLFRQTDARLAVAVCTFLVLSYTVIVVKMFLKLNDLRPAPRFARRLIS